MRLNDPLDGGFTFHCLSCNALTYGRERHPVEPLKDPLSAVCRRLQRRKSEADLKADVWDKLTDDGKEQAEWSPDA